MLFPAVYALAVGLLMLLQWTRTLISGQIPDPDEPYSGRGKRELAFHWVAEAISAAALVVSGIALLCNAPWSAWWFPLSLGMLLYTLINSPGYFAERGEWRIVGAFGVLFAGAMAALVTFLSA